MNATISGISAAILASTVAASFAVAFALEWLCLRSVMALMPGRQTLAQSRVYSTPARTKFTGDFAPGQKH